MSFSRPAGPPGKIEVKKRAGAGYYRAFWEMLLNFDDEAISERLAADPRLR